MEWIDVITKSIEYIEKNLTENNLSCETVANSVNISSGHFGRAFNVLTGFTVSEYIRNRRLSIAGDLLKNANKSVLDVSLDIGYDSPEAFCKAFKRFHNVTPIESKNCTLQSFAPIQVKLSLIQEYPLCPRIEDKEEVILNGNIEAVPGDNTYSSTMLWKLSESTGALDALYDSSNFKHIAGLYYNSTYTIKAISSEKTKKSIVIPPHRWAIFNCNGELPSSVDETWDKIYSSWLPSIDFEISDLPQLEIYKDTEDSYYCEIWIPIEKGLQ